MRSHVPHSGRRFVQSWRPIETTSLSSSSSRRRRSRPVFKRELLSWRESSRRTSQGARSTSAFHPPTGKFGATADRAPRLCSCKARALTVRECAPDSRRCDKWMGCCDCRLDCDLFSECEGCGRMPHSKRGTMFDYGVVRLTRTKWRQTQNANTDDDQAVKLDIDYQVATPVAWAACSLGSRPWILHGGIRVGGWWRAQE